MMVDFNEFDNMNYEELFQHIQDAIIELGVKMFNVGHEAGGKIDSITSDSVNGEYYPFIDENGIMKLCDVEYVVNHKKKTVVALLRGYESLKVYATGIARCHPDESFNVSIGKSIALSRVLECLKV